MDKNSATPSAEPPVQNNNSVNDGAVQEPVVTNIQEDVTVVEATPAVVPNLEPTPASTDATTPTDNTVLIKPPKKKLSLAAIIGFVIFGLLLVGGIGFAIWYFAVYQSPQNVAFDAVNKFLSAESIQTKGQISLMLDDEDEDMHFLYRIELDNMSKTLPNTTTAKLSMSEVDAQGSVVDDHTVSLDLGTVVMSDGVIYFQVANLLDAIDTVTDGSMFETEVGRAIYEIIELVDGEWWKISIPEIVDELELGTSAQQIKNLYSCVIEAGKKDYSDEYVGYYRAHQFINVEKATDSAPANGTTDYIATIDYDNLAGFLNQLPHSSLSNEVTACYNTYAKATGGQTTSPDEFEEVTAADLKKEMPEDLYIRLNITNFGHELKSVTFGSEEENEYSLVGSLAFTYEKAEVSAPNSYRPVTELVDEVMEIISAMFIGSDYDYGYDYDYDYDYPYDYESGFNGI